MGTTDGNDVETTADGLRHWRVAGGIVFGPEAQSTGPTTDAPLLLVENERRNGDVDWSTPGGVVDAGESFVGALTREVREETGLSVATWSGPAYRVEVTAPEIGFFLQVEAHVALSWTGEIVIDDPDGIVLSAVFCDVDAMQHRLASAAPFVREPLLAHLAGETEPDQLFEFRIDGRGADRRVHRTA